MFSMLGSEFRIEKSEILFALTSIDLIFVKFPKESSLPANREITLQVCDEGFSKVSIGTHFTNKDVI